MTLSAKSDLTIYLGSCAAAASGPDGGVTAATLQDAAPKLTTTISSTTTIESLTICVKASELSTVWSNPMDLAAIPFRNRVVIRVEEDDNNNQLNKNSLLQPIHTAFLLAGCQGTSERKEATAESGGVRVRVLTAHKASATSQSVLATAVQLQNKQKNGTTNTAVTISLEDDDDMIDEDDLLNEEEGALAPDMKGVTNATKGDDDCGGREPCADCTCGRADATASSKPTGQQTGTKQPIQTSSCGKCGLGDAFRCASCPYLGKPAFKPGEEHLVLDLQDDF